MSIKIEDFKFSPHDDTVEKIVPNRSIIRVSTEVYQDCNGCLVIKKVVRPMRRLSSNENGIHLLDGAIEASSPFDALEYEMPDLETLSDGLYEIHGHVDKSYYGEYDVYYSFSKYDPENKNENV